MKKRIAIPLEGGVLCSHFGHCEQFAAEQGITDVIAGGIGQRAIGLFNRHSINVFVGAPVKSPDELAADLLNNRLQTGANYCDH